MHAIEQSCGFNHGASENLAPGAHTCRLLCFNHLKGQYYKSRRWDNGNNWHQQGELIAHSSPYNKPVGQHEEGCWAVMWTTYKPPPSLKLDVSWVLTAEPNHISLICLHLNVGLEVVFLCDCCVVSLPFIRQMHAEMPPLSSSWCTDSDNQSLISDRDHIYNSASTRQCINTHVVSISCVTCLICVQAWGDYWFISPSNEIVKHIFFNQVLSICIILFF